MNEPKMGFFPKIFYSVAGFGSYKHFIKQKTGRAIVYLLLLSLILGTAALIKTAYDYDKGITEIISIFDKQAPDFSFENGKLNVEGKMPIILDGGGSTVIIDTSGQTDESFLDNYDSAMLITKDKIIQKNYVDKRVTDLSPLQGFKMNKESVKKILPLLRWGASLIIIFGSIFFICGKFISVLFLSIIGLIINSARGTKLPYRDIFKLCVYSITLPLFIGTLLNLIPVNVPYLWLIFYLVAAVYIWGAINTIKKDMEMPPLPPLE